MKKHTSAKRSLALIALLLAFACLLSSCDLLSSFFPSGNGNGGEGIEGMYEGPAFVTLNNNTPTFTAAEITTTAFEEYGALDALGRCTTVIACCGKEIMPVPGEERGSISSVKPSGWKQAEYDIIKGKYLYNRCHLIGWQLSAENANNRNLITGTKYLNIEGMLPFENMVADYIRETENHVMYRITPIYNGNGLLPIGVQMEAYSVEDEGESICFNIFCYNIQPGVYINYATGESRLSNGDMFLPAIPASLSPDEVPDFNTEEEGESGTSTDTGEGEETLYILNKKSKKIHLPTCAYAISMSEANKEEHRGDTHTLLSEGYSLCGVCLD